MEQPINPSSSSPMQIQPSGQDWQKLLVILAVGAVMLGAMYFTFSNRNEAPVEEKEEAAESDEYAESIASVNDFFVNVKNDKVEIAYNNTSKDFRDYETLESLNKFFDSYPMLKEVKEINFDTKNTIDSKTELNGTFVSETGETSPLNVSLIKENGKWAMVSFDLYTKEELAAEDDSIAQLNDFLDSLVSPDLDAAYDIMSSGYKAANTRAQFEEFVNGYSSIMNDNDSNTSVGSFGDDELTLYVDITDKDDNFVPFNFYMVKEEGKWKIDSFELVEANE